MTVCFDYPNVSAKKGILIIEILYQKYVVKNPLRTYAGLRVASLYAVGQLHVNIENR